MTHFFANQDLVKVLELGLLRVLSRLKSYSYQIPSTNPWDEPINHLGLKM
jgi:hypothetical protein